MILKNDLSEFGTETSNKPAISERPQCEGRRHDLIQKGIKGVKGKSGREGGLDRGRAKEMLPAEKASGDADNHCGKQTETEQSK